LLEQRRRLPSRDYEVRPADVKVCDDLVLDHRTDALGLGLVGSDSDSFEERVAQLYRLGVVTVARVRSPGPVPAQLSDEGGGHLTRMSSGRSPTVEGPSDPREERDPVE
jgi:hypothetical protein